MAERKRWSEIGEVGFVGGMRLLFWLYRHGGDRAFNLVLRPVVAYYFVTHRLARDSSREYLRRLRASDPTGESPAPNWRNVYRHLLSFARSAVDKLGVWANPDMLTEVDFPNRSLLLRELDRGRGAILLSAHLGNMEICRSLSRINQRLKLNILVHTRHADKFNRLLRELHIQDELELIEVSELTPATAIRLAECIERGEFIAILADRVPVRSQGRSRKVPFLGHHAAFPEGPFILAGLLKCPVYTVFCTREESGFKVDCQLFTEQLLLPRAQRAEVLEASIRRFAQVLEANVRRAPLQWFNFYSFWDI